MDAKTYTGGSDASMGMAVPDDKIKLFGLKLQKKVEEWFDGEFKSDNRIAIRSAVEKFKANAVKLNCSSDVITKFDEAIDDLSDDAQVPELARYPLDQAVSMMSYDGAPDDEPTTMAEDAMSQPVDNVEVAKFLPEDVVFVPSLMSLGVVKSMTKVGSDFVYDVQLVNRDRIPIGKAVCSENKMQARSKSAVKHAAMKTRAVMQAFVDGVSNIVDTSGTANFKADDIDQAIALASDLLGTEGIDKKYLRAIQTSQYALSAAKQIYEQSQDQERFDDAVMKAYQYACDSLGEPETAKATNGWMKAAVKCYNSIVSINQNKRYNDPVLASLQRSLFEVNQESNLSIKSATLNVDAVIINVKNARKAAVQRDPDYRRIQAYLNEAATGLRNIISLSKSE